MPNRFTDLEVKEIALTGAPLTGMNFLFVRSNEKRKQEKNLQRKEAKKLPEGFEKEFEDFKRSVSDTLKSIQDSLEKLTRAEEPVEVELTGEDLSKSIDDIVDGLEED